MPVYMVERDLPGIKMEQLAAAQKAAIQAGQGTHCPRPPGTLYSLDLCSGREQVHVSV